MARRAPRVLWRISDGAHDVWATTADLEGPSFKRLADAPAEVDPLFAEIESFETGERGEDGAQSMLDEIRWQSGKVPDEEDAAECLAHYRALFVELAALCFAGIRAIDSG